MRDGFVIKICGITRAEDARWAVDAGATALGFNFWPRSARFIEEQAAREICRALPEDVARVAVVVAEGGNRRSQVSRFDRTFDFVDVLQVHGLIAREELPETSRRLWVAVTCETAREFADCPIIVDPSWGQGRRAKWEQLRTLDREYVLSGGLTAENVGEAIRTLRPAGVDVCSGVEAEAGRKDPEKISRFMEQVHELLR